MGYLDRPKPKSGAPPLPIARGVHLAPLSQRHALRGELVPSIPSEERKAKEQGEGLVRFRFLDPHCAAVSGTVPPIFQQHRIAAKFLADEFGLCAEEILLDGAAFLGTGIH